MSETETSTRKREIRARLNELAPYESDGEVTALQIAKVCAVNGQQAWARIAELTGSPSVTDIGVAVANFAAAHALTALHKQASIIGGGVAAEIRDGWEDGGGVGEWLYELLGPDAEEVCSLMTELAKLDEAAKSAAVSDTAAPEAMSHERLREAARQLGRIVSTDSHVMFAALIEMKLNGPEAAMRWIVNASNPIADQDAGRPWDGKESAQEWFDAVEATS